MASLKTGKEAQRAATRLGGVEAGGCNRYCHWGKGTLHACSKTVSWKGKQSILMRSSGCWVENELEGTKS